MPQGKQIMRVDKGVREGDTFSEQHGARVACQT